MTMQNNEFTRLRKDLLDLTDELNEVHTFAELMAVEKKLIDLINENSLDRPEVNAVFSISKAIGWKQLSLAYAKA